MATEQFPRREPDADRFGITGSLAMSITALPAPSRRASAQAISATMQRLRDGAHAQAREHTLILVAAVAEAESLAREIADGGEPYLSGVRETARRLSAELTRARLQMNVLLAREGLA
jgi:hypothetical protein